MGPGGVTDMLHRVAVNGVELEYELRGPTGEPVVLIHWGVGAHWAEPLLDQPALAGRHQLLSYHRAGCRQQPAARPAPAAGRGLAGFFARHPIPETT